MVNNYVGVAMLFYNIFQYRFYLRSIIRIGFY